ncbi:hypothetical protein Nepgr_022964 [Nepenthes gracilis]|uniref:Uncharacterized protein n=1 Tax=Nepenthes gracilis TaxID=150966 RepID=A0AAD3T307_NEPGR|nr:hypothetical protein Nepgr_022964 [Nepenthes gracilis]
MLEWGLGLVLRKDVAGHAPYDGVHLTLMWSWVVSIADAAILCWGVYSDGICSVLRELGWNSCFIHLLFCEEGMKELWSRWMVSAGVCWFRRHRILATVGNRKQLQHQFTSHSTEPLSIQQMSIRASKANGASYNMVNSPELQPNPAQGHVRACFWITIAKRSSSHSIKGINPPGRRHPFQETPEF